MTEQSQWDQAERERRMQGQAEVTPLSGPGESDLGHAQKRGHCSPLGWEQGSGSPLGLLLQHPRLAPGPAGQLAGTAHKTTNQKLTKAPNPVGNTEKRPTPRASSDHHPGPPPSLSRRPP